MRSENINEFENIEENDLILFDMEEDVSLAGAVPTQVTGQEAGRVLGFGCDD